MTCQFVLFLQWPFFSQLYTHCQPEDAQSALLNIQQCVSVSEQWMASSRLRLDVDKTELMWTDEDPCLLSFVDTRCPPPLSSRQKFLESCWRRICHSTSTSPRSVMSASFSHDNCAASNVLLTTTQPSLSSMRSSLARLTTVTVSWSVSRRRRPTSCSASSMLPRL